MDIHQHIRQNRLEFVDFFKTFTLYYDRNDKSFWFWDGEKLTGINVDDIYDTYFN